MKFRSIRRPVRRGGIVATGGALVAAVVVLAGPTAAAADTTLSITYPVTGSTYVQAPGPRCRSGPPSWPRPWT